MERAMFLHTILVSSPILVEGRSMWNDEDSREPAQGVHQVASSWALVAVILGGVAAWSAIRSVIHVAEPIFRTDKMPTQAIPPGKETVWPSDSKPHCDGAAEQIQRGPDKGLESSAGDARPPSPKPLGCESISVDLFVLPGTAMTAEWEALH
jgi:hypothetical protein